MATFLLLVGWLVFTLALLRILATIWMYFFMLTPLQRRLVESVDLFWEFCIVAVASIAGYVHYFGSGF